MGGETFTHGPGLLGAEVDGNILLVLVQFSQVVLLLLVHDDMNTQDGLPDNADLGEFGSGTASDLGYTKAGQFNLEVFELLRELILLLGAQFGALNLHHFCNLIILDNWKYLKEYEMPFEHFLG